MPYSPFGASNCWLPTPGMIPPRPLLASAPQPFVTSRAIPLTNPKPIPLMDLQPIPPSPLSPPPIAKPSPRVAKPIANQPMSVEDKANEELVKVQLRMLAPDGNVRREHLRLCKRCGLIGHTKLTCKNSQANKSLIEEMTRIVEAFKRNLRDEQQLGAKSSETDSQEVVSLKNGSCIFRATVSIPDFSFVYAHLYWFQKF